MAGRGNWIVTVPIQLFFYAVFAIWVVYDWMKLNVFLRDLREQEEQ